MILTVIICLFSNTRESSREFLTAASQQGMNVNEFAYILPWLQDGAKDATPWIGTDGEMLQKVKDQYANTIIVRRIEKIQKNRLMTSTLLTTLLLDRSWTELETPD